LSTQPSLRAAAISGAMSIGAVRALNIVLRIASLAILARVLGPEVFGLMAMAMVWVSIGIILNDAGLSTALIRERDACPALWQSVFWTNTGIGLALVALTFFGADMFAAVYGEPRLAPVFQALAATFALQSMAVIPHTRLRMGMRFQSIAAVEAAAQIAGSISAIVAAFLGAGVWSLVIQQLVSHGLRLICFWILSDFVPKKIYQWGEIRRIARFSLFQFAHVLVLTVTNAAGNFAVARGLGANAVGAYNLAHQAANIPTQLMTGNISTTLYPTIAKLRDDQPRLVRAFHEAAKLVALVIFPALVGLSVIAEPLVLFAVGEEWAASAPILTLLALAGIARCFSSLCWMLTMVAGRSDMIFGQSLSLLVVVILALWVGLTYGGAVGAGAAYLFANLVGLAIAVTLSRRLVGADPGGIWKLLAGPALSAAVMGTIVAALLFVLQRADAPLIVQLLLCGPTGVLVYLASIYLFDRAAFDRYAEVAKENARRGLKSIPPLQRFAKHL